jgi:adenylate cyclase class 2
VKPLEIEIKFYLQDHDAMKRRLMDYGAELISNTPEFNIRFENRDNSLYEQKILLRLRRADKVSLTYKSKPPVKDPNFKIHHEIETLVNDFDAMRRILESIGFYPAQIYEKIRATWKVNATLVCLDRMPYGDFIEIEGAPDSIRQVARDLGFQWKDRILFNYLEIFETLKNNLGLSFSDITFDHFKNVKVDFHRYLHLFVAGAA